MENIECAECDDDLSGRSIILIQYTNISSKGPAKIRQKSGKNSI